MTVNTAMSNVVPIVSFRQRDRSRYFHSQPSNLSRLHDWTSCHSSLRVPFWTRSRSRGGGNARRWWPRSSRTPGSPYSACTRFDYRSRFEDRLIASSVDEEAEKEVVGSPGLVPTATATTTCRLPPGSHEMDPRHGRAGCDWIRPRIAR